MPSNAIADSFKDMQGRAMQIAMENAESAFTFAGKISNAHTVQEVVTLQTQFAQERMQAFVTQTQQLYSAIAEAFQKSERGTMGVSMGAMPSNPIPSNLIPSNLMTGFKDVRDRAVAMAKTNAEFSISLGRKDRQGTEFPGRFRTSVPLCSRADAGLRRADARASEADRGNSPEAPTRLKQKPRPMERRGSSGLLFMADEGTTSPQQRRA